MIYRWKLKRSKAEQAELDAQTTPRHKFVVWSVLFGALAILLIYAFASQY